MFDYYLVIFTSTLSYHTTHSPTIEANMLSTQWRMHPEISELIRMMTYPEVSPTQILYE